MTERDERIRTAEVYLFAGLVRQDGEAVRKVLAADCWRTEQGRNTGKSGEEIASAFKMKAFDAITGIADLRWFVEGEQLVAFYRLELQGGKQPHVLIAERFRVAGDLIREIEAIFYAPQLQVAT